MFYKMADILKPGMVGTAELDIMDYTNRKLSFHETLAGIAPERYARLKIGGCTIMSETPMEHRTNAGFVLNSYGDVLIGGLGIGMIILPIQEKKEVSSVTVLEKNFDVIVLIAHQLPLNNKVRILNEDVYTWKPDMRFDSVYMDIWGDLSTDDYDDMKRLKRKYGHYLKPKEESPDRINMCWNEYAAKHGRRFY